MNEMQSLKNQEKANAWNQKATEIDQVGDRLRKRIDEKIKDAIIALNLLGINTTASCEGHIDWATGGPYIDVEALGTGELKKALKKEREEKNEEKEDEILDEITHKNLEERKKLIPYFEEFYQGREVSFSNRLIIQSLARGWSRIENQGVDLQKLEAPEIKEQKLQEFQKEMADFTEFLKGKFFSK
jgi:hypothetical protein